MSQLLKTLVDNAVLIAQGRGVVIPPPNNQGFCIGICDLIIGTHGYLMLKDGKLSLWHWDKDLTKQNEDGDGDGDGIPDNFRFLRAIDETTDLHDLYIEIGDWYMVAKLLACRVVTPEAIAKRLKSLLSIVQTLEAELASTYVRE